MGNILKIGATFIYNNWKGLLMMAVIGVVIFGVRGCVNTKEENVQLKEDIAIAVKEKAKSDKAVDSLTFALNKSRQVAKLAEDKFKESEKKRAENLVNIRKFVSTATPKQKRDTLVRLAEKWTERNLPDTVEPLSGKPIQLDSTSYSQDETDKILWTVLDAAETEKGRDNTAKVLSNYQAKVELLGIAISDEVNKEKNKRYFLGIGRKKGADRLKENIQRLIESIL